MEAVLQRSRQRGPHASAPGSADQGGSHEHGAEQLKSALAACEFRLRSAEQARGALEGLLVPVEEVRRELEAERRRTGEALRENELLFKEAQRLSGRVSELEAKLRRASAAADAAAIEDADEDAAEAELRSQILRSERLLAAASQREAVADAELREAQDQTRMFAAEAASAKAEGARVQERLDAALERIQEQIQEKIREESSASAREMQAQQLRAELDQVREVAEGFQTSLERVQGKHDKLQAENSSQHEALCKAAEREGALASRLQTLEADLKVALLGAAPPTTPQRAEAVEAAPLGAAPPKTPQRVEVVEAALPGAAPPTPRRAEAAGAAGVLALRGPLLSELKQKPPPPAPPESSLPRSRRDYPKGAHGRLARKIVLGLPTDVPLGDDLPRWDAANRERWQRLVLQ